MKETQPFRGGNPLTGNRVLRPQETAGVFVAPAGGGRARRKDDSYGKNNENNKQSGAAAETGDDGTAGGSGNRSHVFLYVYLFVPLMPSFIKLDLSELPALIAAFSMGPLSGAAVCLVKNLVNVMFTTTGGVGELSNFLLGCFFVVPAGLIYKYHNGRMVH